jgi:hypothetical protein
MCDVPSIIIIIIIIIIREYNRIVVGVRTLSGPDGPRP